MIFIRDIAEMFESITNFRWDVRDAQMALGTLQAEYNQVNDLSKQYGGADVMKDYQSSVKKCQKELGLLSLDVVFGTLYINGTPEEKAALKLFNEMVNIQFDHSSLGIKYLFKSTAFEIIRVLIKSESTIADEQLSDENIILLFMFSSMLDQRLIIYDSIEDKFENQECVEEMIINNMGKYGDESLFDFVSHYTGGKESLTDHVRQEKLANAVINDINHLRNIYQ